MWYNDPTMKINKETITNLIKHNILFLIGVVLLIYKSMFLNAQLGLDSNKDTVLYTLAVSLLLMSPLINTKNKFAYIYLNVMYAIVTVLIYANFLYCSYSHNFLSMYQIENTKYAKEIGSGLLCIINAKNMLLFLWDNILVLIASIMACHKCEKTSYGKMVIKLVLILLLFILNIVIVRVKINGIYDFRKYNKALIFQDVSVYYYHYEDAKEYITHMLGNEKIDEAKVKAIAKEILRQPAEATQYTGLAKDANVIILQLESLNEYVIGKKVNEKEITPHLNQFFQENIYCSEMYNQGLGTTADSEFEMENSLYPLENGYAFQKYATNDWNDIYSTLRSKGYYTSFMHPNVSTFWNREEVYKTGYKVDEYDDINAFSNIESAGEFYSDEGFFLEGVKKMKGYHGKFCTTMVSITTHIPFYLTGVSDVENKTTLTQEDVQEFGDETFRNYLISCNFVDYAFGEFLEELRKEGLLENSILIAYGDHGAGLTCTEDIQKLYEKNGKEYTTFENLSKDVHIPCGMKVPGITKPIVIDRATAKIDIKPTILDLLGERDNISLGRSIFSKKDYAFIKGLGLVTKQYYWNNGNYYDRTNNAEITPTAELEALLQKMDDEIYVSDAIIKNNLIKTITK